MPLTKSALELRLTFETDPDDGYRSDPDLSASWGAFELRVGDNNLCRHVAHSQVHNQTHWYLLPMLEWFVENWERLFHESRLPAGLIQKRSARESWLSSEPFELEESQAAWAESWWMSHALRASAQGGVFPDVFLRRHRDELEVSWGPASVPGAPEDLRFLAPSSTIIVPVGEVAEALHLSLGTAIGQLFHRRKSARIGRLVERHAALRHPDPMRAQWLAGWPSVADWAREIVSSVSGDLGQLVAVRAPLPLALFGSLSPSVLKSDVCKVLELLESAVQPAVEWKGLDPLTDGRDPWEQGYELAERARLQLKLGVTELPDLSKVLDHWNISERELPLTDAYIRAIALCGNGLRPTIAVNTNCQQNFTPPGRRFTLAHELCHLLFDQEAGVPLAVASGPWAPTEIEQRANAFAAMFLMPTAACQRAIDRHLRDDGWNEDVVRAIAADLGTGKTATLRHLDNLRLIDPNDVAIVEQGP